MQQYGFYNWVDILKGKEFFGLFHQLKVLRFFDDVLPLFYRFDNTAPA